MILEEELDIVRNKNIKIYKDTMPKIMKSDEIIKKLCSINYFTAPSSNSKHGAWIGGNFDHSLAVTNYLIDYTKKNNIKWSREESPYIIGMFHDLCKSDIRSFYLDEKDSKINIMINYNRDLRHSEKSLSLIINYLNLDTTFEERLCIYYHMGKYDESEDYIKLMDRLAKVYNNIYVTQEADTFCANNGI